MKKNSALMYLTPKVWLTEMLERLKGFLLCLNKVDAPNNLKKDLEFELNEGIKKVAFGIIKEEI